MVAAGENQYRGISISGQQRRKKTNNMPIGVGENGGENLSVSSAL
jgi:hypothetical protein